MSKQRYSGKRRSYGKRRYFSKPKRERLTFSRLGFYIGNRFFVPYHRSSYVYKGKMYKIDRYHIEVPKTVSKKGYIWMKRGLKRPWDIPTRLKLTGSLIRPKGIKMRGYNPYLDIRNRNL